MLLRKCMRTIGHGPYSARLLRQGAGDAPSGSGDDLIMCPAHGRGQEDSPGRMTRPMLKMAAIGAEKKVRSGAGRGQAAAPSTCGISCWSHQIDVGDLGGGPRLTGRVL